MKTVILAVAAAALVASASPAFAQAPNDAAATLRQGENYSKAKLPSVRALHSVHHRTVSAAKAPVANGDNSADQLNAKQLGKSGS